MLSQKIVNNIIGKKKKIKDTDGDGVPDNKDCQPKNTMRQDYVATGFDRMVRNQENRRGGF